MSDLCPIAVSQDSGNLAAQPKTAGEAQLLLFKQKKYCDVTFTFQNLPDRIEAHQLCLRARSPVFDQLFRMRTSGNVQGNEIEISGSTPERFQQFLEFVYTDKLEVDIAGALDLLQLAGKYKIQPLTEQCEELLKAEIKAEECVKVFEAARRHGHQELVDRAGEIMIKSFPRLARKGALVDAEEVTVSYLLQSDELSVQEVGLFEFILDWGKKQAGSSASDLNFVKEKLKNVISKIRYTNMTPLEFTTVVAPTGLLSAEETSSVYSYLCGGDTIRRDLKIGFNKIQRKVEMIERKKDVDFYHGMSGKIFWSAAVEKQCVSFRAERGDAVTERGSDYLLKKAVITGIIFKAPLLSTSDKNGTVLNFSISVREHFGPADDKNFTLRFQKVLLNPKKEVAVSVDPPVDLIPGKTFSISVEDLSTSNSVSDFRNSDQAYYGTRLGSPHRQQHVELEDARLVLKEIQRTTAYYLLGYTDTATEIVMIGGIVTGLV